MASPSSQCLTAKIFTLPPELIEETLILSALCGFPSTIAKLGQTCRYFHQLIFRPNDNHLWREAFLTIFDDPRPLLGRLRNATTFASTTELARGLEIPIDWASEFMERMDAQRIIKRCAMENRSINSNEEQEVSQ